MSRVNCSPTNAVGCKWCPLVNTCGVLMQMRVATLLHWPMSLGWHGIWIRRCNIPQKRRMCGTTAMMPLYLHGGTSYKVCGVLAMLHNCVSPLVSIWPVQ